MIYTIFRGFCTLLTVLPFLTWTNEISTNLGITGGPCLSGPCIHGICVDKGPGSNEYRCYCVDGYTGLQCQTDFDDCRFEQCQNGATCLDRVASVQCLCPDGFSGLFCELNVNECLSNPCLNGACCIDQVNGFQCICHPGYQGVRCEIDVNYCNETESENGTSVCHNGGTCVDGAGRDFYCSCPVGFDGTFCEHDIDECVSSPCQNGGECVERNVGNFSCNCPAGFTGRRCEVELRSCDNNHCQNDALCLMEVPSNASTIQDAVRYPRCFCIPDYHGEYCDKRYNECELLKPCMNGATCIDDVDSVQCICPIGFYGTHCQYEGTCPSNFNDSICPSSIISSSYFGLIDTSSSLMITTNRDELNSSFFFTSDIDVTSFTMISSSIQEQVLPTNLVDNSTIESSLSDVIITPLWTEHYSNIPTLSLTSSISAEDGDIITSGITESELHIIPSMSIESKSNILSLSSYEIISSIESEELRSSYNPEVLTTSSHIILSPLESSLSLTTAFISVESELNQITTTTKYLEETSLIIPEVSLESTWIMSETPKSTTIDLFSPTTVFSEIEGGVTATVGLSSSIIDLVTSSDVLSSTTITPEPSLPNDCSDLECANGGTILQEMNLKKEATICKCLCPLYFTGPNCEGETQLVIPYLSGRSYLKHQWNGTSPGGENSKNYFSLILSFRTDSEDAFLLYADSAKGMMGKSFVLLSIQDGTLSFTFSCGSQVISLSEKSQRVSTGYFTAVSVALMWIPVGGESGYCEGILRINDSSPMIGKHEITSKPILIFDDIYIGGFPVGFTLEPSPLFSLPGFKGCVKDFQVNNVEKRVIGDALEGAAITECQSYGCAAKPCLNGATCKSGEGGWFCLCLPGYFGVLCERATCTANPCQNGGTCVSRVGGFFCMCPYGKHGKTCEESMAITRPAYFGNIDGYSSYLLYNNPHNVQNFVEIRIRFTLRQDESFPSLLVYVGQPDGDNSMVDFLALGLDNGYLVFLFNLGTGVRQLRASHPLKSDQFVHSVYFGRHRRYGWLRVNGFKKAIGLGEGQLTGLNVAPEIFIGGHSSFNFSFLPDEIRHWRGFKGCIFDEEVRNTPWAPFSPLDDVNSARNVHQCDAEECDLADCDNEATCQDLGSTFMCHCKRGWTGPLCKSRVTPCSVGSHKCSHDSKCVPSLDGYRCDCPLGKSGTFCDIEISISDPLFRGQGSFMSFVPRNIREETHLVLEIKANSTDGLIFYASQHSHSQTGDFVSMVLKDGYIEFRYNLGTGSGKSLSLKSQETIMIGEWTSVKAGRSGRYGYLEVDGQTTRGSSPKGMKDLDVKSPFYLGGIEDPSWVNREAVDGGTFEAYQGCVRRFEVNDYHYQLNKEGALDGLNIEDCDGTGCGYDVCQHNGTCQFEGQKFLCICSEEYAGQHCELPIQCSNHLCQNGATCRAEGTSYQCECPPGWDGERCQNELKLDTPYLDGEAFLLYKDESYDEQDLKESYLSFSFKTHQPTGIILWNGKVHMTGGDYLGIGLIRGHLKLVWNLGYKSQSDIVTGNGSLADGQWHNVTVERLEQILHLQLDEGVYKSGVQGDYYELNAGPLIYLGGFAKDETSVSDWTGGHFKGTFRGCVTRLLVGKTAKNSRKLKVVGGANVKNCPQGELKV